MRVEFKNIHKRFGPVHANNGITMSIPAGTIQGILGENGAGKSTLMKVLSGFIQADEGEILLDGKTVRIETPADAIRHGIGMLHQDPLDFPPMTVVDNMIIGREGEGLIPNRGDARKALIDLQKEFDFHIDPDAYVDSLTVGERQQLEILRLLWLGARVLIMDEPTTGISALQRQKLFAMLRKLIEQGKTVIFVSHKLEEVEGLCGRVAVFQRGKLVGEVQPPYVTQQLVQMMFGKVVALDDRMSCESHEPMMKLSNLSIEDYRINIRKVNLDVCRGEVIGLAGMEGSGQRQFLRACAGLIRPVEGKIQVNGQNLTGKPYHRFLEAGITYLPAARLEEGLISGLSLTDHFTLTEGGKGIFIQQEKMRKLAQERIEEFNIRGTPDSRIDALSGGNQQRALLALMRTPLSMVLMEHPTRGLDIESAIYIWGKLKERCKQGTSILFISSDLEEILHYSDRILVFFGGKVSEPIPAATTGVEQLGQLIGGKGL
jgi:simple sugar transport system ATP-binding protein